MLGQSLLLACCLVAAACSSGWRLDEQRAAAIDAVDAGASDTAVAIVNQIYHSHLAGEPTGPGDGRAERTAISDKHGLLWRIERGLIALRGGRITEALDHFRAGRTRATDLLAADLVAGALSAVANDTVRDYVGTAYEREFCAYFAAIAELTLAQRQDDRIPGPHPGDDDRVLARLDRAVNEMRNLCLVQVPRTEHHAGGRYRGAAFFHLMAAASVLVQADPLASDLDFAEAMLTRAAQRYRAEHRRYTDDAEWRYHVAPAPDLVDALRRCLARARRGRAERGSVLVLVHRDYAVRPLPLDIRLVNTDLGSLHADRRRNDLRVGWMAFSVRGPGAWQVQRWSALPMPGELTEELAPGGISVFGFSVPAHPPDTPLRPLPAAALGDATPQPLAVLADCDAWARAHLAEHQVQILLKTLTRAALKQIAAGAAAHAVRKEQGDLAGLLVGLIGSGLATASEQADIRAATLLPDHIVGGLIDAAPGRHRLVLETAEGPRPLGSVRVVPGRVTVLPVFLSARRSGLHPGAAR